MASEQGLIRTELAGRGYKLIEFLLARIAEDEQRARDVQGAEPWGTGHGPETRQYWMLRALADCESKREIVDLWQSLEMEMGENFTSELFARAAEVSRVCRMLARAYSGHPDFRDGWLEH